MIESKRPREPWNTQKYGPAAMVMPSTSCINNNLANRKGNECFLHPYDLASPVYSPWVFSSVHVESDWNYNLGTVRTKSNISMADYWNTLRGVPKYGDALIHCAALATNKATATQNDRRNVDGAPRTVQNTVGNLDKSTMFFHSCQIGELEGDGATEVNQRYAETTTPSGGYLRIHPTVQADPTLNTTTQWWTLAQEGTPTPIPSLTGPNAESFVTAKHASMITGVQARDEKDGRNPALVPGGTPDVSITSTTFEGAVFANQLEDLHSRACTMGGFTFIPKNKIICPVRGTEANKDIPTGSTVEIFGGYGTRCEVEPEAPGGMTTADIAELNAKQADLTTKRDRELDRGWNDAGQYDNFNGCSAYSGNLLRSSEKTCI